MSVLISLQELKTTGPVGSCRVCLNSIDSVKVRSSSEPCFPSMRNEAKTLLPLCRLQYKGVRYETRALVTWPAQSTVFWKQLPISLWRSPSLILCFRDQVGTTFHCLPHCFWNGHVIHARSVLPACDLQPLLLSSEEKLEQPAVSVSRGSENKANAGESRRQTDIKSSGIPLFSYRPKKLPFGLKQV